MTSKNSQIKLEEKILDFEFEIIQAQFNKNGKYFLKISIQNSHREDLLPKVMLDVNKSGEATLCHITSTDSVTWDISKQFITFQNNHFKFTLPKGFCKNDKNYDVHLMIEAFQMKPSKVERVGEALLPIYPRTETPKANLFVKKGEDYYKYASVLTLLRPFSKASISMHCGRLSYSVAFREFVDSSTQDYSDDDDIEQEIQQSQPAEPKQKLTAEEPKQKLKLSPNTLRHEASLRHERGGPRVDTTVSTDQSVVSNSITDLVRKPSKEGTYLVTSHELESEGSFNISIASTPLPIADMPSPKQKTMDVPAGEESPKSNASRSKQDRQSRVTSKSPTMTSPRPPNSVGPTNNHVAKPGYEEIYVIIHGATSLPSRSDGSDPVPFATIKSIYDEQGGRTAQCSTHASLGPTHSPTWEEIMTMQVPEDKSDEEELILTLSDSISKEKLVTYRVPVGHLVPFHPYHFEFVQPTKSIPSGIRLYITMQRRLSHLPRLQGFGFCGLEVTLRDFQQEISNPIGSLLAVARIVPDYTNYKDEMLSRHPWSAGVTSTTVTFPSPNPSAFEVMKKHQQGFPQLTTPSKENSKPCWDHMFMFSSNDTATMFSHNSALVLELYPASTSMSSMTWTIRNPVGFCTLLLDDEVFQVLTSDAGRTGIRVDDLILQGSQFESISGSYPSIRLILRLITTERPDTLVVASDPSILPTLDSVPTDVKYKPTNNDADVAQMYLNDGLFDDLTLDGRDETAIGGPPFERKKTRLLVKDDEFPPSDVLETILPDYVLSENDTNLNKRGKQQANKKPQAPIREKSIDDHNKSLLDHQSKELMKYREAVKRMSSDIVTLRGSIVQLQEENALLRRELLLNKEIGQNVMDDIHKGIVSSTEVADKFVAVRQKLVKETDDLKKYKTKVQHLQNQMIKANEREKQYLTENSTKKELEDIIHHLQDKLKKSKKIEETCLQQEKVIQKMEKLLNKYMKNTSIHQPHGYGIGDQHNTVSILSQENSKLQSEIDRMRIHQQQYDADKSELLIRLERAENRVTSLETQLDHNARGWAKEKHELTVRLQEHRNGIVRTTGADITSNSLL